jgi:hypothetical protein
VVLNTYNSAQAVASKAELRAFFRAHDLDLDALAAAVRARPGRLSALSGSHGESGLHGAFVWAPRALDRQKLRFSARQICGEAAQVMEMICRHELLYFLDLDDADADGAADSLLQLTVQTLVESKVCRGGCPMLPKSASDTRPRPTDRSSRTARRSRSRCR